jgi:hypothetical protein
MIVCFIASNFSSIAKEEANLHPQKIFRSSYQSDRYKNTAVSHDAAATPKGATILLVSHLRYQKDSGTSVQPLVSPAACGQKTTGAIIQVFDFILYIKIFFGHGACRHTGVLGVRGTHV